MYATTVLEYRGASSTKPERRPLKTAVRKYQWKINPRAYLGETFVDDQMQEATRELTAHQDGHKHICEGIALSRAAPFSSCSPQDTSDVDRHD